MTDWKGMPSGSLTELLAKLEATPFEMKDSTTQALCYVTLALQVVAERLANPLIQIGGEEKKDG